MWDWEVVSSLLCYALLDTRSRIDQEQLRLSLNNLGLLFVTMVSVKFQYVYYSKTNVRDKNRTTRVTYIVFHYTLPQD